MARNSMAWVAVVLCAFPAFAGATDAPTFDLAKMDDSAFPAGFSPAKTEGDTAYRVVEKGALRMMQAPAWWDAKSMRPPEDTVWVLEVLYKDTVATPAICYGHGGLERNQAPAEVHRFGGENDGKWKTAYVPVGWDQLMRLTDHPDRTAIGFKVSEDMPVSRITVRPADKDDAERFNAETRAWVAKVQAEKRKQNPVQVQTWPAAQIARTLPLCAYAWPATVVLHNHQLPGSLVAPIKIRMCLNELEGGSFGVYAANGKDLTGVDYAVSDLVGDQGKLTADVIRRTAEYALALDRGQADKPLRWVPQRLWPAYKVDRIPAGQSHWFLFNLRTQRGKTKPGLYKGTVTITSEQGKASLPVEVDVLSIDLMTMDEAGLFMGGCMRGLLPAHDFTFAAEYNQNGSNWWYSAIRPGTKLKDGKLELDFTFMDEWMASAKKRGLKGVVWFLGGDPYGFPMTMSLLRHLGTLDAAGENKAQVEQEWAKRQSAEGTRDKPLPEDRKRLVEWTKLVMAHAKQAGWPQVWLSPFDEPAKWVEKPGSKSDYAGAGAIGAGPWIKPYFQDGCAALHEASPDVKIYASINHNRTAQKEGEIFLADVDVFCTNPTSINEDPLLGDKVRKGGKTFWQYSNVGRHNEAPELARSVFGFYFASFGSRGSLCWAYNWGPGFDTTAVNLEWTYAWQTPFDMIPAPYFEGMREAWDDRRIIETYRKQFAANAEALAELNTILKEACQVEPIRGEKTPAEQVQGALQDTEKLVKWRNQLLDRMVRGK